MDLQSPTCWNSSCKCLHSNFCHISSNKNPTAVTTKYVSLYIASNAVVSEFITYSYVRNYLTTAFCVCDYLP